MSVQELERIFSDLTLKYHLKEGLNVVAEYRQQFGGHKVNLTIEVMQPICIDCKDGMPWIFKDVPDISADNWGIDLMLLGFHPDVISDMEKEIKAGIDPTIQGPFCYECKRPLPYWDDEDSACYCMEIPFSVYIGHHHPNTSKAVSKGVRKAVLEAYGTTCFGCGRNLLKKEVTMDHIVPKSEGGTADRFNLQPLCCSCNHEKDDQLPMEKTIVLHSPVRPLPSDAYEGIIW